MSKIQIIIPVWRSSESLLSLLSGLVSGEFEITVVENRSDLPVKLPPKLAQKVHHIQLSTNTGFAHAANVGWRSGAAEWCLFLNPDTSISAKEILHLLDLGTQNNIEAFSPLLTDESGKVAWNYHQPLPNVLNLLQQFSPLQRVIPLRSTEVVSNILRGRTLPGACVFISRGALEKIGGWDERFWLWWEDADLSLQLEKAGVPMATFTDIHVQHAGAETFRQQPDEWKRQVFFHSLRVLVEKHFSYAQSFFLPLWTRQKLAKLLPRDSAIRSSVVVPNLKFELLESFLQSTAPNWEWDKDELIVVSSSKEAQSLVAQYPEVSFIWIDRPLGFAKTVNLGWQRVRGTWIGTVNDDTILPKNFIQEMISGRGVDKVGSIQPKVIDLDGNIESFGVQILPEGRAKGVKASAQSADTVNAAAVLFHRKALEAVGFFDESFESYLEDVDLGLRMSHQGWKHAVQPDVTVIHLKHQTMKAFPTRKAYLDMRNWWKIVLKPYWRKNRRSHSREILTERVRNISGLVKSIFSGKR